jgi:hypothetical protein
MPCPVARRHVGRCSWFPAWWHTSGSSAIHRNGGSREDLIVSLHKSPRYRPDVTTILELNRTSPQHQ